MKQQLLKVLLLPVFLLVLNQSFANRFTENTDDKKGSKTGVVSGTLKDKNTGDP